MRKRVLIPSLKVLAEEIFPLSFLSNLILVKLWEIFMLWRVMINKGVEAMTCFDWILEFRLDTYARFWTEELKQQKYTYTYILFFSVYLYFEGFGQSHGSRGPCIICWLWRTSLYTYLKYYIPFLVSFLLYHRSDNLFAKSSSKT